MIIRKTMMRRMSSRMLRMRMKTRLTTTVEMSSGESMGLGSGRIFDAGMRSLRRGKVRGETVVRVAAMRMMLKVEVERVTRRQVKVLSGRMKRMNIARLFDIDLRTFHYSKRGGESRPPAVL